MSIKLLMMTIAIVPNGGPIILLQSEDHCYHWGLKCIQVSDANQNNVKTDSLAFFQTKEHTTEYKKIISLPDYYPTSTQVY